MNQVPPSSYDKLQAKLQDPLKTMNACAHPQPVISSFLKGPLQKNAFLKITFYFAKTSL